MSWKSFVLGVATGVLVVALLAVVLLRTVASPAGESGAPTSPVPTAGSSTPAPDRPGSVRTGETWLGAVDLSSNDVLTADGPLLDVDATGARVSLTAEGLRAGELTIRATLPFETAAQQMGEGIELYAAGELAGLRRTVEILGQQVRIDATGRVQADDGQLLIEPQTVDLGSFEWVNDIASATIRAFVTIRHTVTGLPEGMDLDAVDVSPDGFRVELSGTDVRIG